MLYSHIFYNRPHHRLVTLLFYDLINNNGEFVRVICASSTINPLLSDLYEPNRHAEISRRSETPIGGGTRMGTTLTEFIGLTHILFACHPSVDNAMYSKTALLIFTAMLDNKNICKTLLTEMFYTMPLRLDKVFYTSAVIEHVRILSLC